MPTRIHSVRPLRAGTIISIRPRASRITQSSARPPAGVSPVKTASVETSPPETEIRRGTALPGMSRRHTVPRLGQGGVAASSAVTVAFASGTSVGRFARATGVSGSARSPRTGVKVGIGATRSDRTTRSSSGGPAAPRWPTWTKTGGSAARGRSPRCRARRPPTRRRRRGPRTRSARCGSRRRARMSPRAARTAPGRSGRACGRSRRRSPPRRPTTAGTKNHTVRSNDPRPGSAAAPGPASPPRGRRSPAARTARR